MPMFEYTARNPATGQIQKGQLDVPSKDDVIAYLRKNRMMLVSVREAPKQIKLSMPAAQRIKTRDIVIFTRQFATMINAGLPLVQSLDDPGAADREQGARGRHPGGGLRRRGGQHPGRRASASIPRAFTDLYVNMVAAGEAGGILDTILLRLATFLEKNDALMRKVKGAMVYPGVIMTVAAIAIAVLLIFVIPAFQSMFASVNLELPLPTRIVIGLSDFLIGYWWAILLGIGAAIFAIRRYYGTIERPEDHRLAAAQVAGAGRPAPEVGRVPVHPDARHADLVGRLDSGRARDHGEDRRQHGHPRCGHGVAPVDRGRRDDRGPAARSRRCSRPW